jgi:hypothetical protein
VVNISGVVNGSVYAGQYQLKKEDNTLVDAFCVDPVWVKTGELEYEVVTPSALGDKYVQAAWLWENITTFGNDDVVAAQVAIWETTWDNGESLNEGDFRVNYMSNGSKGYAEAMLAALQTADLANFDASGYRVVVNNESQDFLIRYTQAVPEPNTIILLLMGLVCFAGIRKKHQ